MKEVILAEIKALAKILRIKTPISVELKSARDMYNRLRDLYREHSSEFTKEMISECKRLAAELDRKEKTKRLRRNLKSNTGNKKDRKNQDTYAEKQAIRDLIKGQAVTVRIVQGGSPGLNKRKR